ncbi:4'-phosphopantetheinyl transferase family protein [Daejeonella oryzae]|uniref:4'-phosphopantetheinyl transferase family protein n=1 Tax=Daejeonella oryzae TaxID=1122943 RepID=UPI00041057AF|nr:4'-phosphopantetheinyl transferase superfamily protein [Daejeonella oryzae]
MALAYQKKIDSQTSFALWKIEETADELFAQLQLKEHELTYLDSLNNGKRNLHWLSTRVLLRTMLQTDEYIDCKVDEHGKPYLANFPHHISLSHSFDYAAVMISVDKAVGIDIELMKNKIERIARKFMSEDELDFIDPANKTEHLYMCWCAKEAIYKLQGKKQVSFLNNIRLNSFECDIDVNTTASLQIANTPTQKYDVKYHQLGDYMIGYVAKAENEE